MSTAIRRFRVVVFEETVGPELGDVLRLLGRAGYQAVHAEERERWRTALEDANCALVMAYRLTRDLLPSPFGNGHVPRIVLMSPLDPEAVIGDLPDPGVVHAVLQPGAEDPLLVRTVTRAVIADSFQRLDHAIQRDPEITPPLRRVARDVLIRRRRRVNSAAGSIGVHTRTLQKHWAARFGADAPRLSGFCHGTSLLQIIREVISEPPRSWNRVGADLDIPRSTLRGLTRRYTGRPPSKVDLKAHPGLTVAHVLAGAVPAELLEQVLRAEDD